MSLFCRNLRSIVSILLLTKTTHSNTNQYLQIIVRDKYKKRLLTPLYTNTPLHAQTFTIMCIETNDPKLLCYTIDTKLFVKKNVYFVTLLVVLLLWKCVYLYNFNCYYNFSSILMSFYDFTQREKWKWFDCRKEKIENRGLWMTKHDKDSIRENKVRKFE